MNNFETNNNKTLIQKLIDFIVFKILKKKNNKEDKKNKSKTDDIYPMW